MFNTSAQKQQKQQKTLSHDEIQAFFTGPKAPDQKDTVAVPATRLKPLPLEKRIVDDRVDAAKLFQNLVDYHKKNQALPLDNGCLVSITAVNKRPLPIKGHFPGCTILPQPDKELSRDQFAAINAEVAKRFCEQVPQLADLDLSALDMVVAGGSVGGLFANKPFSDIDIFFVADIQNAINEGDIQAEQQWLSRRIKRLEQHLANYCAQAESKTNMTIYRTPSCITFVPNKGSSAFKQPIQVVLRVYPTIAQLIHDFDFGSSAVAYVHRGTASGPTGLYGSSDVYFSRMGEFAYRYGYNVMLPTDCHASSNSRIQKYLDRGFAMILPDFKWLATYTNATLAQHLARDLRRVQIVDIKDVSFEHRTLRAQVKSRFHLATNAYGGKGLLLSDYQALTDYELTEHNVKALLRGQTFFVGKSDTFDLDELVPFVSIPHLRVVLRKNIQPHSFNKVELEQWFPAPLVKQLIQWFLLDNKENTPETRKSIATLYAQDIHARTKEAFAFKLTREQIIKNKQYTVEALRQAGREWYGASFDEKEDKEDKKETELSGLPGQGPKGQGTACPVGPTGLMGPTGPMPKTKPLPVDDAGQRCVIPIPKSMQSSASIPMHTYTPESKSETKTETKRAPAPVSPQPQTTGSSLLTHLKVPPAPIAPGPSRVERRTSESSTGSDWELTEVDNN